MDLNYLNARFTNILKLVIAVIIFLSPSGPVFAQAEEIPTNLVIRAKAMDGKFIGSSVGGAYIKVKNADTGELYAEGLTEGSTGNTHLIMNTPKARYDSIAEGAAKFETTLNISEPVYLTIEVIAPYIKKQARVNAQTQIWLVPGKHIEGDGIIIEIPGMIVDILSPQTHAYELLSNSPFEIKANVVIMCGCIFTKEGLWDGNNIEVQAIVTRNGEPYKTIPLKMQDKMNTFLSSMKPTEKGIYQITVYAYDPKTGNTGVDKTSFVIN